MRLGIISDSHHYYDQTGDLHNLTVLTRQFGCWANLFEEVVICAPLLPGSPPVSHSPYQNEKIRLLPVSVAGGQGVKAKWHLLQQMKDWWRTIQQLLAEVDALHIRCPNNISILGLLALQRSHHLRQAVYTGTWPGYPGEPLTYRWQRWFLRRYFRGPVAVYGEWPGQPEHIVPSFTPTYAQTDWGMETERVTAKIAYLETLTCLPQPLQLVTVGALSENKNQQMVIRLVAALKQDGVEAVLHLLGEGASRTHLEALTQELGVTGQVHFHGYTPAPQVREFYRQADFVVQAPRAEGFGKVPVEAFFHGVIPLLSDVNLSQQLVGQGSRGRCFPLDDLDFLRQELLTLSHQPITMAEMIPQGRAYAATQTLESWQKHLEMMFSRFWGERWQLSLQG